MQDIYEQLKSGRCSEDLVAEFVNQINEAEDRIRKEEAAEMAKAKHAEIRKSDLIELLKRAETFALNYYPNLYTEQDAIHNDADWSNLADLVLSLLDLELIKPAKVKVHVEKAPELKTNDEVFKSFFKMMGL